MDTLSVKKIVAEQLATKGWIVVSDFDMEYTAVVAHKYYETAVGRKQCSLYFLIVKEGGFKLTGDYQSEGRNVLSTTWHNIPDDQISDKIRAGIDGYSDKVDSEVDQSYARRLFLTRA